LPYDVTQENFGAKNFTSYRVNSNVTNHIAKGLGVYQFFVNNSVIVNSAIVVPENPNVIIENALTVFLGGNGTIKNIVNNQGKST